MNDLRTKIAREICISDRIDPDAAVIVRMQTLRAWESRLPHADRILALPEIVEMWEAKYREDSYSSIFDGGDE